MLVHFKELSLESIDCLAMDMRQFLTRLLQRTTESSLCARPVAWSVGVMAKPLFVFGRYRKLSRDVSHSCWTAHTTNNSAAVDVDASADNGMLNDVIDEEMDDDDGKSRVGRTSVEVG